MRATQVTRASDSSRTRQGLSSCFRACVLIIINLTSACPGLPGCPACSMTPYDYVVLAFYFAYMLAISWVFRRFVTNVSDYFRGGGKAVWWMVGGSAFMMAFSA